MHRINQQSTEALKRLPMPLLQPPPSSSSSCIHSGNNSSMPDLLWISKQQQQHPSTHAHPLKNTIRISSNGVRYKFDGKQWRPLCESPDGYECRNLAFRSSLCQKHFYKLHLYKRPYIKSGNHISTPSNMSMLTLKRPLINSFDQQQYRHHSHHHPDEKKMEHHDVYDEEEEGNDDDSIQVLDNNEILMMHEDENNFKYESQPKFKYFNIDSALHSTNFDKNEIHRSDSGPALKIKRLDSTNNESVISNESDSASLTLSLSKVNESVRLGTPPLTRTEEKSIANELIFQLPADASFSMGEQLARRRANEIISDNYAQQIPTLNISSEWFYDFLLRNPRVPIHFQTWFATIKSAMPSTDQLIDIKIWELGLITRSVVASSSVSTGSSSP